MDTKTTLVLLATFAIALSFVAVAPTATAHNCYGLNPSDCGPCTSGYHNHTWCSSSGELVLSQAYLA